MHQTQPTPLPTTAAQNSETRQTGLALLPPAPSQSQEKPACPGSAAPKRGILLPLVFLLAGILLAAPLLWRQAYRKGYDAGFAEARYRQAETENVDTTQPPDRLPAVLIATDQETRSPAPADPTAPAETRISSEPETDSPRTADAVSDGFIGNRNSKKFHLPTCASLPEEENRILFESREEALEAGYTPCKRCNP